MAKIVGGAVNPTAAEDPRVRGDDALPGRKSRSREKELGQTIQNTIRRSLERAKGHFEEKIQPDLVTATEYYDGDPFGDEEDGRSKVVSTDLRDAVLAQMPSLMRIFYGPRRAVEFRAHGLEDEAETRQMTDYVNYILTEDNPGFLIFYAWFKDALVRRLGIVKWWYDESYKVSATEHTGLTEQALQYLAASEGVENVDILSQTPDPELGTLYHVRVTRREEQGCPRYAAVPPEEFHFTPGTRDIETAPLVAHVREVTVDTLRQLEIDEDLIQEAVGKRPERFRTEDLSRVRRQDEPDSFEGDDEDVDESQRKVLFAEAYAWVDGDGDGISELRLFQCVGPSYTIANGDGRGEIVDEAPFAVITPDPEPHALIGLSNFDLLKDVQRVKSEVLRGTLNSLSQAIEPTLEVVSAEVNMADLLNPEISGVLRVNKPGMVREIKHQFVGNDTLPVLEYFDQIKENRTGQTKAAQGLDADALQSSTKAAVAATLTASQARIELIGRIFAETGVKRLMQGVLRLVAKNQDRKRIVRLQNQYVEVDPRSWNADKDVIINVGLGQGTPEDQVNALGAIMAVQEKMMGVGSPLVTWVEVRAAVAEAATLAGFRNADKFFRPWGPQEEQNMAQQKASQPPQPDPQTMLVQLEQQKAQQDAQIAQLRLQLDQWKAEREDDRERDKIARDAALKEYELELKYAHEHNSAQLELDIARERNAMEMDNRKEIAQIQASAQPTGSEE